MRRLPCRLPYYRGRSCGGLVLARAGGFGKWRLMIDVRFVPVRSRPSLGWPKCPCCRSSLASVASQKEAASVGGSSLLLRWRVSGSLLPPSPPAEKATASKD